MLVEFSNISQPDKPILVGYPVVHWQGDPKKISNYAFELIRIISGITGLPFQFASYNGTFDEAPDYLINAVIDMTVLYYTPTEARLNRRGIACTYVVFDWDYLGYMFHRSDSTFSSTFHWENVFTGPTWIVLVALATISMVFPTGDCRKRKTQQLPMVLQSALIAIGIAQLFLIFQTLVLRYLLIEKMVPFDTHAGAAEALAAGQYRLVLLKNSSAVTEAVDRFGESFISNPPLLPYTMNDAVKAMLESRMDGEQELAFMWLIYDLERAAQYFRNALDVSKPIPQINGMTSSLMLANFTYHRTIDKALNMLQRLGITDREVASTGHSPHIPQPTITQLPISIGQLRTLFLIAAGCLFSTTIFLFLELGALARKRNAARIADNCSAISAVLIAETDSPGMSIDTVTDEGGTPTPSTSK